MKSLNAVITFDFSRIKVDSYVVSFIQSTYDSKIQIVSINVHLACYVQEDSKSYWINWT